MAKRAYSFIAAAVALVAAIALAGCDVPAAGKPILYAGQEAAESVQAAWSEDEADTTAEEEAADESVAPDDFNPLADLGKGVVVLYFTNDLGTTITSVSVRGNGAEDWPDETHYTGVAVPNGSDFILRMSAAPTDAYDLRFEGADGTTFLIVGTYPAAIAMDHAFNSIITLCYDSGITYFEYTNLYGLTVDTHLSAQEGLASLRAQLEARYETYTFTERDMEGVEAGQTTENCLD